MHGDPGDSALASGDLARVQTGPELHTLRQDGLPNLARALHGARWTIECHEEAVAGNVDQRSSVHRDNLAHRVFEAIASGAPATIAERNRLLGGADYVDDEEGREHPVEVFDVAP